jgi:hypothetical protein
LCVREIITVPARKRGRARQVGAVCLPGRLVKFPVQGLFIRGVAHRTLPALLTTVMADSVQRLSFRSRTAVGEALREGSKQELNPATTVV